MVSKNRSSWPRQACGVEQYPRQFEGYSGCLPKLLAKGCRKGLGLGLGYCRTTREHECAERFVIAILVLPLNRAIRPSVPELCLRGSPNTSGVDHEVQTSIQAFRWPDMALFKVHCRVRTG